MIFVGTSSYGDLRNVPQYMNDEPGCQLIGLLNEVNAALGYTRRSGPRITPNEAFRSKDRQAKLLAARQLYLAGRGPYAALAASPLYTSNHGPGGDITKSRAVDIGVSLADGGNRALDSFEQAVWRAHENAWGFVSAGDGFSSPEPWHKEYRLSPTKFAPVGIKVATLTTDTSTKGTGMLAKAVNDVRDTSLGTIKGRLFAISDGYCTYNGTDYHGSVRFISDKTEASTLSRFGTTNVDSTEIWDLVKNRKYARIGW